MIERIIEQKLIEENRRRKIEYILGDNPFVPYTKEMAISEMTDDFWVQLKESISKKLPVKLISDI